MTRSLQPRTYLVICAADSQNRTVYLSAEEPRHGTTLVAEAGRFTRRGANQLAKGYANGSVVDAEWAKGLEAEIKRLRDLGAAGALELASESLAAPAGHPTTAAHVNACAACQQNARAIAQQDRAAEVR